MIKIHISKQIALFLIFLAFLVLLLFLVMRSSSTSSYIWYMPLFSFLFIRLPTSDWSHHSLFRLLQYAPTTAAFLHHFYYSFHVSSSSLYALLIHPFSNLLFPHIGLDIFLFLMNHISLSIIKCKISVDFWWIFRQLVPSRA